MPVFDIPKNYQDGSDLTEAILDAAFEYVETSLNTTKLDSANLQSGAVVEATLASSAISTAKIQDSAVTTAKLADANVTLAKLASEVTANHVPPGIINAYVAGTAPTGWLLCDGSAVSRTTYAALYAIIGITHGSGNTTTTFNVPDMRGRFIRGVDGTAGRDPDKASRTAMNTGGNTGNNVGSVQGYAVESHTHTRNFTMNDGALGGNVAAGSGGGGSNYTNTGTTGGYGGNETRPVNAYEYFIIKT